MHAAGRAKGYEVMPFPAGHLVGGCIWRITTPIGESIVYAPDFNNRSEHHLGPSVIGHILNRPALLIAGASTDRRCPFCLRLGGLLLTSHRNVDESWNAITIPV